MIDLRDVVFHERQLTHDAGVLCISVEFSFGLGFQTWLCIGYQGIARVCR